MNAHTAGSLDGFPLEWRFTSARLGPPATQIHARISPLQPDAAAAAARAASQRIPPVDGQTLCLRSDDAPAAVRASLLDLPVSAATCVLVSWNERTALATDWETFTAHWDDFCYPASDDIVVWDAEGDWTLRYHHYEVFQFWRQPATERDRA